MRIKFLNSLFQTIHPCFLILTATALVSYLFSNFLEIYIPFETICYLLIPFCMALSIYYKEERLVFAAMLFGLILFLFNFLFEDGLQEDVLGLIFFPLLSLVYPLNFFILKTLPDENSFFASVWKKAAFLLFESAFLFFITFLFPFLLHLLSPEQTAISFQQAFIKILHPPVFGDSFPQDFPLTAVSLLSFFSVFVFLLLRTASLDDPVDMALLTGFILSFFAFLEVENPVAPAIFFFFALLSLLCGVFQNTGKGTG